MCSMTDVVKVRVMNDKERQFKGISDCVRTFLRKEGPLAFYKGFGMCWARVRRNLKFLPETYVRVSSLALTLS